MCTFLFFSSWPLLTRRRRRRRRRHRPLVRSLRLFAIFCCQSAVVSSLLPGVWALLSFITFHRRRPSPLPSSQQARGHS